MGRQQQHSVSEPSSGDPAPRPQSTVMRARDSDQAKAFVAPAESDRLAFAWSLHLMNLFICSISPSSPEDVYKTGANRGSRLRSSKFARPELPVSGDRLKSEL
jgi:hypothetical protein